MPREREIIRALDEAPLTRRFLVLAGAVMFGAVLDLFDFFLIAFVVPVVSDEWDMTFGQAAAVLLSAGVGAIAGSIVWGRLGDRYGRKRPLIWGILTFSLATGVLALAPPDGWWFLALFRLVVGAGVAGVAVIAVPLTLEFTPTRLRTKITGFVTTAMVPIGIGAAALAAALLIPAIGWRPVFAIGLLPVGLALFVRYYVPESPRWLLEQGRTEEAWRVVDWLTEGAARAPAAEAEAASSEREAAQPPVAPHMSYRELFRYRASVLVTVLAWFGASVAVSGLVLWGPTFLESILEIDSDKAALLFVFVTLGSFAGRLCFSFLPQRTGRRMCGLLMGFGAPPLLALAAMSGDSHVAGVSLFLLALIAAAFFVDGGFANLAPYTPEIFPARLRTHGMGLAWTMSGVGRIIGPLGVGLIAGTGDIIDPEATADALLPAFLFLAACSALVGIGFALVPLEPHGKDLETLSEELIEEAARGEARAPAALADL
jgi:MFS transporter, putative metabolite:H+ symporter